MGFTTPRVSSFSLRTGGADGIFSRLVSYFQSKSKWWVVPSNPFRVVGSCLQLKQTGGVHVLWGIDLPHHAGVVQR